MEEFTINIDLIKRRADERGYASYSEVVELLDQISQLGKENASLKQELMFACEFDAYTTVEKDRYDLAIEFMEEDGRIEPSFEDEVNGLRKLIQLAMESENGST